MVDGYISRAGLIGLAGLSVGAVAVLGMAGAPAVAAAPTHRSWTAYVVGGTDASGNVGVVTPVSTRTNAAGAFI